MRVAALILSAGFSSRMGEFKPLLPLGGMGVLERTVTLFRAAGVDDVRVVTGFRAEELEPLLARLGARAIPNPRYREGMFGSAVAGMESIDDTLEAFFILPVDIPLVRPATVRRLLEEFRPGRDDLLYPCFRGERGHPPLVAARNAAAIAAWKGEEGLRGALGRWQATARPVEVADEHILSDMDTPQAYGELKAKAARHQIPSPAECGVLLERFCGDEAIIRHGRAVADLALLLAARLNRAGLRLDLGLLEGAALVHDIARQEKDHARAGASLLRQAGFGAAADLVAGHMDLTPAPEGEITPRELLYLADKLVQGERRVTLAERFRPMQERHAADPSIFRSISDRFKAALIIQTRLEGTLGCSLAEVIGTK